MFSLSDLILFRTVAEACSITRAAEGLHRVQSHVTARVNRLPVQLVTGTSGSLIAQLRAGEISAAFVSGDIREPDLIADPAFIEELVLITHPSTRRPPRPTDLRDKTLVAFGAGCTYRACVETWL